MNPLLPLLSALGFLLVSAPQLALAQPGSWQPASPLSTVRVGHKRSGLLLGFAAGSALGDDALNQTGGMASAYVGGFLNPNLAVMFTTTAFHADEFYDDCFDCTTQPMTASDLQVTGVAAQRWLSDRLWVRGSLGIATATISTLGDQEGFGWGAAAGVDLISGNSFALDLRFNAIGGVFEPGKSARAGLGLGFSWR